MVGAANVGLAGHDRQYVVLSLAQLLALGTIADDIRDGLLDAAPVVSLCDDGGGLVDTGMGLVMYLSRDFELPLRVGDDLLVLEHQDVPL